MWTYNREYIGSNGYLMVANKSHIIPKSRYVALQHYIPKHVKKSIIHHVDFNKSNNRLSNLLILTKAEHNHIHKIKRVEVYMQMVYQYRKRQEHYLRKKEMI